MLIKYSSNQFVPIYQGEHKEGFDKKDKIHIVFTPVQEENKTKYRLFVIGETYVPDEKFPNHHVQKIFTLSQGEFNDLNEVASHLDKYKEVMDINKVMNDITTSLEKNKTYAHHVAVYNTSTLNSFLAYSQQKLEIPK
jgi:hypothetical protein